MNMRKKLAFFLAFALLGFAAFAQNSQKVSALLESEEITKGQAAYFVCVYKNIADEVATEDEAFSTLASQNLFGGGESADEAISLDKACFVIARVSDMKGGVFYSLSHSARYAFREFKALGIVPSNAAPQQTVSGGEFLALLNGFEQKAKTGGASAPLAAAEVAHIDAGESMQKIQDEVAELGLENVSVRQVEQGLTISLDKIQFLPDSAELLSDEKRKLDQIAVILKEFDNDLLITGHTALRGNEYDRQRISEERAQAVADYLAETDVRDISRMTVEGKGATEPIAANDTEEGVEQNRRVEITILTDQTRF